MWRFALMWSMELLQIFSFMRLVYMQEITENRIKRFLVFLLGIFFFCVSMHYENRAPLILLPATCFLCLCIFEEKKLHTFWVFWSTYWIVNYIDQFCAVVLSFISKRNYFPYLEKYPEIIFTYILSLALIVLIYFGMYKIIKKDYFSDIPDSFFAVTAIGGLFFYFFVMPTLDVTKTYEGMMLQNIVVLGINFSGVLFIIVVLALFSASKLKDYYKKESQLKDDILQASRAYCRQIIENDKEVRKLKHDINHHLNTIQYFVQQRKYVELSEYLSDIQKNVNEIMKVKIVTGNELLDAILSKYVISEPDIKFQINGSSIECPIRDYDLCSIFSNAITNAVEACKKSKNVEKNIQINLKRIGGNFVILIKNPISEEIGYENDVFITTKNDKINHGYGIRIMKEIVAKYNGNLKIEITKGYFKLAIFLPVAIM